MNSLLTRVGRIIHAGDQLLTGGDSKDPGALGSAWSIGTTALWIVVLLSAYIGIYYL